MEEMGLGGGLPAVGGRPSWHRFQKMKERS
jgi:hypothetical protein